VSVLCRLDELADPGALGFVCGEDAARRSVFVVRKGGRVYGYANVCPHAGAPLDWMPGVFLDEEGKFLCCGSHGALFGIEDGLCVAGPCRGARLTALRIEIVESALECPAVTWPDAPAGPVLPR
jgi:nitrite reductase/ring-hydroxylating ferredoxin subunit